MSGARRASTRLRRAFAGRPGRGQHLGRGADQARRAGRRRAQRLAQRHDPRRHDGAAAGPEHLQVDVIVARVDDRDHRQRVVGGDQGRGIGGERRQADRRLAGGERDAARRGDADAQAGEAAGPGGDGDAVERGEFEPGARPCTRAISGIRASAWPRTIGSDSCAEIPPCSVSSTAAEQASSAVSMARTRMIIQFSTASSCESAERRSGEARRRHRAYPHGSRSAPARSSPPTAEMGRTASTIRPAALRSRRARNA